MKKLHILLVEDNEGDIVLTLDAIEESNVKSEISIVKNGQDAMNFLYQKGGFENVKKPDLILLDINIPILNGHEVLKEIKSDPNLKNIPVIIVTTSENKKDMSIAFENDANSFMTKPIDMDEFVKTVVKIEEIWTQLTKLRD